jgi:HK97 family phage portal protein
MLQKMLRLFGYVKVKQNLLTEFRRDPSLRFLIGWNRNLSTSHTADLQSFAEKGYGGNAYVYAIVNEIASKCASVPWSLYRIVNEKAFAEYRRKSASPVERTSSAAKKLKAYALETVDGEPLNDILNHPSQFQTWHEFILMVESYKLIMGNSFVLGFAGATDPESRQWKEIIPYRADQVSIYAPEWPLPVIGYRVAGSTALIPPERVMHIKTFHPLQPRIGMSPLEAAFLSVKTNNGYAEWNDKMLENMATMPGLIEVDQEEELTEEQRDEILRAWRERNAGGPHAGMPFVATSIKKFTPMAFNPKEMEWTRGKQMTANEIALAFGWPPELVGDASQKTYSNLKEMVRYAYYSKIIPELDAIKDSLNVWLVKPYSDERNSFYLDFNLEDIEALQEDRTGVWDRTLRAWREGLLTMNQALLELGFEEIGPEGDVRQIPFGLTSSGSLLPEDDGGEKAFFQAVSELMQQKLLDGAK